MAEEPKTNLLIQIHDLMDKAFSLDDLRELCHYLEVDYDNLREGTKSARIHDLVQQQNRKGKLNNLLYWCGYLRPNVTWPDSSTPVTLGTTPASFTMPPRNPRQIFLSHASQDAEFAHQLADDLRRHDWQVWIAPDSIQLGEDWVQAINRGLAESGIFLLVLTPDAVNSRWVTSETNVAIGLQHRNEILFIPLDVKAAAAPPLWYGPQNVPFQSDYKGGLERLLQRLQPQKMAQVDGLYRQMQQAVGRRQWPLVQTLGAQIVALYPDYRETAAQMALAQQAEAREKRQTAEAAALYDRLQAAMATADWTTALALAEQIEMLVPDFQDVSQLAARARRGQQQARRAAQSQWLRHWLRQIPVWGWVVAAVVLGSLFLGGVWAMMPDSDDETEGNVTATSAMIAAVETDTPSPTPSPPVAPEPTTTRPPTSEPTAEPTSTSTHTATPTSTPSPTLTATPAPGIGSTRIRPADEAVMVYVPAGEFVMGSDDGEEDEKPLHAVYLDSYWIDQTEVTNDQFAQFVTVTGHETTAEQEGGGYTLVNNAWEYVDGADWQHPFGPNSSLTGRDEHPVVMVSWLDALAYCEWVGGRLPTEAEWEKAARWDEEAQEARTYPWGNTFDGTLLNFCDENCPFDWKDATVDDGYEDTAPVGSYPDGLSPYGALDMAGNVWEWTADWYDGDYYAELVYDNPTGPATGTNRVLRGGSWNSLNDFARAALRNANFVPSNRSLSVGFRCAQE